MDRSDDSANESAQVNEVDRMLGRAVNGDHDAMLWIRVRAANEPGLLEELVLWQADELRLARAARELCVRADRVEALPSAATRARRGGLGWAVAAMLALALVGEFIARRPSLSGDSLRANIAGVTGDFSSTDAAFDAYVATARDRGALIGQVAPPTLVRSRELTDGRGFEIVVVRQVYERRTLPEMYRLGPTGETGQLRPIVIRSRTFTAQ